MKIPEEDISYITLGQKANINNQFSGEIVQISPSADPDNRKFEVKILYNNKKQNLSPETLVEVSIEFKKDEETLLIPINAVTLKQDISTIYLVENNTAKLHTIETGIVIDNMIEVTEGLNKGDQVIISGFKFVEDGEKVTTEKQKLEEASNTKNEQEDSNEEIKEIQTNSSSDDKKDEK